MNTRPRRLKRIKRFTVACTGAPGTRCVSAPPEFEFGARRSGGSASAAAKAQAEAQAEVEAAKAAYSMPTVTVHRQPQGKLGCRISANNTVSEVHAGGVAKAAGLLEGWLVKAINGIRHNGRDSAANGMLADLVKQSVFKFEFDVEAPAPPREKLAVARLDEPESGHVPSQAPTSKSPLPATTRKGKSPQKGIKKEAQRKSAAPAPPAAKRTKATAPAQVKGGALAVSALKKTIRSDAVDVCADLCKRLDEGDADAIALLTKMYPPQDTKRECVFCGSKFVSGGSSTCTAIHDVDEFGDYERTRKGGSGNYGTFSGECSRCRETIEADGPEDDGPDTRDLEDCYCGPHSSNKFDLKAFRVERMGQAAHDEHFGSDDAEYK